MGRLPHSEAGVEQVICLTYPGRPPLRVQRLGVVDGQVEGAGSVTGPFTATPRIMTEMDPDTVTGGRGIATLVQVHLEAQGFVMGPHGLGVGRGEDRGDALQGGHGGSRYRGTVRRPLSTLVRAALVVGVIAFVRAVLLDLAPRQELHGDEPVIGSLDTWPAVPRKARAGSEGDAVQVQDALVAP